MIRPRGYKTLLRSVHLSMKLILLINVKMPTIVGILSFISRIDTPSDVFSMDLFLIIQHFSFNEQLKLKKSVITFKEGLLSNILNQFFLAKCMNVTGPHIELLCLRGSR